MSIIKSTNSGLSTIPITVEDLYKFGYIRLGIEENSNDIVCVDSNFQLTKLMLPETQTRESIFVNSKLPLMQIKHNQNLFMNKEEFVFMTTTLTSHIENKFGYNPEIKSLYDLAEIEKEVIEIYKQLGEKKK